MSSRRGQQPAQRRGMNVYQSFGCFEYENDAVVAVYCFCDRKPRIEAVLRTVRKDNENYGRGFFSCESPADRCNFFLWEDALEATAGKPYVPSSAGVVVPYEEPTPSKKKKTPVKKPSSSKGKSATKSQAKGKKRRVVSSSEEDDETESDYEVRDCTPSPPRRRGGRRLADSPSPSDLALVGTSTSTSTGGSSGGRNRKKPRREPSPDWPDPDEQEEELRRKDREIAALRRQVMAAEEVAKKAKDEAREKRVENEGLVKQLYPGIWCVAPLSLQLVETD